MINKKDNLVGCIINYTNNRTLKVVELTGRGATSVAYKCEVYIDGVLTSYGILKEYMPIAYADGGSIQKLYSIKKDGERYISRYLPAQKEAFIKAYSEYKQNFEKTRQTLNKLILEDPSMERYIVKLPDPVDCIFELDEEKNTYVALHLYTFYSNDSMEKIIKTTPMRQRLEMLEKLSLIIDKLHENHLLVCDLKPENFIYMNDGITTSFKLFDFDSFKNLNGRYEVIDNRTCGTSYFSAPEILRCQPYSNRNADVYSVGAVLLYLVCFEVFESIVAKIDLFSEGDIINLKSKIDDKIREELLKKTEDKHITRGFWFTFKDLVLKSMSPNSMKRCKKGETSPMQQLHSDLVALREIYENKGVHPSIMLNNALRKAKEFDQGFEIDERLFSTISESVE